LEHSAARAKAGPFEIDPTTESINDSATTEPSPDRQQLLMVSLIFFPLGSIP
jgi:hypothetical protein